jgi:hypothetical protein
MSVAAGEGRINVRRNVTAGSLLTVSGAPARRASELLFMNADEAAQATAEFAGDDGTTVVVTVPASSTVELCGDFETVGTLAAGITCIAGWVDDGSVIKNA